MPLLININDIAKYRQMSKGIATDKVDQFIREAQEVDFGGIVSAKFYNDIVKNWQNTNYQELLTGAEYVYEDYDYRFEGLKAVLAYFAYGRILTFGNSSAMPHDFVQKTNEWSDPISTAQRRDMRDECRQIARKYWDDCLHYLKAKEDEFPNWDGSCVQRKSQQNIEKI